MYTKSKSCDISTIHKRILRLFSELNMLIKSSKLQMIQGEDDFPWSNFDSLVARPYVFEACQSFLLHIETILRGYASYHTAATSFFKIPKGYQKIQKPRSNFYRVKLRNVLVQEHSQRSDSF